ncbi:hypothetical protein GCM10023152_18670 [Agromyces bauzanensis]|uniref:Uncharacterized protein n=1 Tax=Agromyces bauzanensis TaxID=1308924 RepID=A0A917PGJ2_9MICO|nr:hypothetical protein GCM10011372_13730 [Agromyces bauzanensis]
MAAPRSDARDKLLKREEAMCTGVYVLLGNDPGPLAHNVAQNVSLSVTAQALEGRGVVVSRPAPADTTQLRWPDPRA